MGTTTTPIQTTTVAIEETTTTQIVQTTTSVEDHCPCGWIKNGQQCYKYFETTSTRSVAEAMCEREGGNLVSIHSPEENNFVHQLSMCTEEDFWIGSHDKDSDRFWEWTDSSPWTFANWAR